jgi:zinc finger and BTB domain-containing protein 48
MKKKEVEETQNNEKKFQCQKCPKSFEKQQSLYQHEQIHKPKVKCEVCSKKFSKRSLKDHLQRHKNIKEFNCDYCSAGFVTKGDLTQHMWKHRSVKRFDCTQCNRGFNGNRDFKVHLQTHSTNPRPSNLQKIISKSDYSLRNYSGVFSCRLCLGHPVRTFLLIVGSNPRKRSF